MITSKIYNMETIAQQLNIKEFPFKIMDKKKIKI